MNEIERSRLALHAFFEEKSPIKPVKPAQAAIKSQAQAAAPALAALAATGLGQAWNQHPLKQGYEQVAPLAQDAIRQHPWLSLGAASALGALVILSPGLRRKALESLGAQIPPELRQFF